MSYIERMTIQGIRSFGPDESDKQLITFYTPLTLILGPNGTGKTTLIECLKYITTGQTPAGGTQKGTFIHDPKIARESVVKAQVRLQLRNVSGVPYVVQRAMSLTQLAKTSRVSTLEGMVTKKGPDGKKQSITSRCSDIDAEMITLLGVSKPILEHVIFCHQEDSCWPLGEGKALKQKFDDIFASTRYVKALEIINKQRKSKQDEAKTLSVETKYLRTNKEMAEKLTQDMEEAEARCAASRESVEEVERKLKPIQEKLNEIHTKEKGILEVHTALNRLNAERDQIKKTIQELRDNINDEFEGTTEQLREVIEEFETKVDEYEKDLRKNKRERERVQEERNQRMKEREKLLQSQGKLEHEAVANKENIKQRDKLIQNISAEHQIQGYDGSLEKEDVQSFLRALNKISNKLKEEMNQKKAAFEKREKKMEEKIAEETRKEAGVKTEINLKRETMETNSKKIKESRIRLKKVEGSADRLSGLEQELKTVSQDLEEHEKSINLEASRREIDKLNKETSEVDIKFTRLDNELTQMHKESGVRARIAEQEGERDAKESQIRRLKNKNEDALEILFCDELPTEGFSEPLRNYNKTMEKEIKRETDQLEKYKLDLSGRKQERSSLREQLTQKEKELEEYENKIYNTCGTQDFDAGMEGLDKRLNESRNAKSVMVGTQAVFQTYMDKLKPKKKKKNHHDSCPLCHQSLETDQAVEDLIQDITATLEALPSKLTSKDEEIDELQKKYEKILTMTPYKTSIADLREETIPRFKERVAVTEERIVHLNEKIAEKEEILKEKRDCEERGKSLVDDMSKLDTLTRDVRGHNMKIEELSASLMHCDSSRSLEDVQKEKDNTKEELGTLRQSAERKQRNLNEQEQRRNQLNKHLQDLRAEKYTIEGEMQGRKQLEDTVAELLDKNSSLTAEIQKAKEQLEPLRESARKLTSEKNKITEEKVQESDKDKGCIEVVLRQSENVEYYQTQISSYLMNGRDKALETCRERLEEEDERLGVLQRRVDSLDNQIQEAQKNLASQQTRERELQDNLSLRNKERDVEKKEQKIGELEEKQGNLNVMSLSSDKKRYKLEEAELEKEKNVAAGRQQSQYEEIKKLKENLRREEYQNAGQKYHDKIIDLRTTEITVQDLEKYHRALDRTIMSYHKMKMDDINKIIRELWIKTYRGNDIETIEICHDEDSGSNLTRRVYNYRMVMVRNDVKLDMRGRCSAGQRVLASLIIRLALAETFCINCGVLALDEPTTNLDRENIESLAYALVEIIKGRSRQKNFQLVIITHDEDFVELLGRSEYIDKFWKVRKNEFGCSRLVEANVSDLGSR